MRVVSLLETNLDNDLVLTPAHLSTTPFLNGFLSTVCTTISRWSMAKTFKPLTAFQFDGRLTFRVFSVPRCDQELGLVVTDIGAGTRDMEDPRGPSAPMSLLLLVLACVASGRCNCVSSVRDNNGESVGHLNATSYDAAADAIVTYRNSGISRGSSVI